MAIVNNESIIQEFITESREHLEKIEPDLLLIEKEGKKADPEIIHRVFRAIHSIKGAAGFLGFEALKNLGHGLESVLMLIRDGELEPTPEIVDALIKSLDKLQIMVDDVYVSNDIDYHEESKMLDAILSKNSQEGVSSDEPVNESPLTASLIEQFSVTSQAIESEKKQGKYLFILSFSLDESFSKKYENPLLFIELLESIGTALDIVLNIDDCPDFDTCLSSDLKVQCLYASVLEGDLIAEGLGLSDLVVTPLKEEKASPVVEASLPESISEDVEPALASESKNSLASATKGNKAELAETIRVRTDLIDKLMNLAGEIVLVRNQLSRIFRNEAGQIKGLEPVLRTLDVATTDLQESITKTRMQPIGNLFSKFQRVARDLSKQMGKQIILESEGDDVEIDKSVLEALSDPMTHLIRNACDHGLEMPEDRQKAGKPPEGKILLKALHEAGQINISISDDGQGINEKRVLAKAIERGLIQPDEAEKLPKEEIANFIFMPGFSTNEEVSDVSGRGVGMDVVRTNIEKLGGNITIKTDSGKGTTITLRLPLTLAIINALTVGVQDLRYAIPQLNILEIISIKPEDVKKRVEKIGDADALHLRGKLLPLARLSDVLELERTYPLVEEEVEVEKPDKRSRIADRRTNLAVNNPHVLPPVLELEEESEEKTEENLATPENFADKRSDNERRKSSGAYNVIVLKAGNYEYGLIVDQISNLEEIVVKPTSLYAKGAVCFAGVTILGDGQATMILDTTGIIKYTSFSFSEFKTQEAIRREAVVENEIQIDESKLLKQDVILFNNATEETFAVPLTSVFGLERVRLSEIEQVGKKEFINYRGNSIPLIRLESYLPIRSFPEEQDMAYLIIPKEEIGTGAILASHIINSTSINTELKPAFEEHPGILGIANLGEQLTVFIDIKPILELHSKETQVTAKVGA